MFIVLLKFAENKTKAPEFMEGHKAWIEQGFNDGVFSLVGSVQPNLGGAVFAHGMDKETLENRVKQDPFVIEGIVQTEIIEITPSRTHEQLSFLLH